MSGHTPGPWRIGEYGKVIDTRGRTVRLSGVGLATGYTSQEDECFANDRLVAAAPELLAALKAALCFIESLPPEPRAIDPLNRLMAICSDAINKAEGRS